MNKCLPLAPYVRSFFEDHLICRRNVSANTIQSYRDALKLLLRFAAQVRKKPATRLLIADITEPTVLDFLTDLERTRGNSIQTRNYRLVAIRTFFEYIAAREPLLLEHCRRIVAIPRKRGAALPEIGYLEKDQVAAILGAVEQGCPRGRRDYALLLFMYNTGARVQEAADVKTPWLHLTNPFKVELLGKGRKWRSCPLWDRTARHLGQLIQERGIKPNQDAYLFVNRFGRPLSRSGIADIIQRYATKAAATLPSLQNRRVSPHMFRHTTAMHLLQSGVELNVIRGWLGHVSIGTTNRYVEIDLAMKAKALEACTAGAGPDETRSASWNSNPDILAWLEAL